MDGVDARRVVRYSLPGDWTVLAGRTAQDNDYVSCELAQPNDWWFHVRGMPGSHVILVVPPESDAPDRKTLEQAAAIAAWHSKARGGGVTPVSGTEARNVTKPRGAPTGTVEIRRETVFKVRPALPAKSVSGEETA